MNFTGTILLVDDEPHIRNFIGLVLRQVGAPRIVEAGDGEEALAVYQREHPDLVLLDINMPGLTGVETLQQLKAADPDCLVVMLTSLASRQIVEETLALGAVGYIRKDTPKDEIIRTLSEIIASCLDAGETAEPAP
jgi:DNA-binding NarL/FixJ family response regulator